MFGSNYLGFPYYGQGYAETFPFSSDSPSESPSESLSESPSNSPSESPSMSPSPSLETYVSDVSSTNPNGTYGVGDVINIQVTFDTIVQVTGTPRLNIGVLPSGRNINYVPYGPAFVITVKTDNVGISGSSQFVLPLISGETYDFTVDYDGQLVTHNTDSDLTLTFPSGAGTYDIYIYGTFPGVFFPSGVDNLKLLEIKNWGDSSWKNFGAAFNGCANLVISATDNPDVSQVISAWGAFRGVTSGTDMDCRNWNFGPNLVYLGNFFRQGIFGNILFSGLNTPNVTTMHGMCRWSTINSLDMSNTDTSGVTSMLLAFQATIGTLNVTGLDVSNVIDFGSTFQGQYTSLIGYENWNPISAVSMHSMFSEINLTTIDISNWNTPNLESTFLMFTSCPNLTKVTGIGSLNISSLTDATGMLSGTTLDTSNYDELLIGWAAQPHQPNVPFHGGNSKYSPAAAAARALLVADGWTIIDGGPV